MHFIAGSKLSSNTNPVSFTNIPQTFTHLQLRWNARATYAGTSSSIYFIINNKTAATDWSHHELYATGTGALSRNNSVSTSTSTLPAALASANGLANTYGAGIIDILDYTNTTKRKVFRAFYGQNQNATTQGVVGIGGGQPITLAVTDPITQLDFYVDGLTAAGSSLFLYGITSNNIAGV
jgi:hypothetical protein